MENATVTKQEFNQDQTLQMYMLIGSYESKINKYAKPNNWGKWDKYNRLKKKILQWQNNIHS
ncbi:hypothetical protein 015DV002_24 [Bacillus phage 015DV002]|nr:hypothetical protein 000TH008_38 [Bacillus phage 000TH008]QQO40732.1 hypothetical protein 000TH009_38 [Bacillus phage 000TH009]QQO40981.1 hypothetical protein 015DV002_24 [Bacillus phage 015DV002]QQO41254.1 hypothetical protein 015DV004_38 [Bacillus phage 015DV004]